MSNRLVVTLLHFHHTKPKAVEAENILEVLKPFIRENFVKEKLTLEITLPQSATYITRAALV